MKRNSAINLSLASLAMVLMATAAFATSKYDQVTQDLGPAYYWHFDEATGTTLAQAAVGSTTLYYQRAIAPDGNYSVPGINRTSASYTTGSDKLSNIDASNGTGTLGSFAPNDHYTVEFWLNPTSAHSGYTFIANLGSGFGFCFQTSPGATQVGVSNTALPDYTLDIKNDGLVNDQWNMVAMTFQRIDASHMQMMFYSNGRAQDFWAYSGTTDIGPVATFTPKTGDEAAFATFNNWGNMFLQGTSSAGALDEFAIFNKVLSQQDILSQFDAVPEPGMLSLLAIGGALMVWRRKVAAKRA